MKLTATVTFGREETRGAAHFSAEQAKIQVWLAADFWSFFLGDFEASLNVAFPISFSTSYGLQTEARWWRKIWAHGAFFPYLKNCWNKSSFFPRQFVLARPTIGSQE